MLPDRHSIRKLQKQFPIADVRIYEAFSRLDPNPKVFAKRRGVYTPADASFLFHGEGLWQARVVERLDRDDVALPAKVKINCDWLAQHSVTIGIQPDYVLFVYRDMQTVVRTLRRPALKSLKLPVRYIHASSVRFLTRNECIIYKTACQEKD